MAFLVTGPILGAHVLAKSGVSSRSVSWFTLEWLRRPTRCPRAPFAKQSRCQSQENADASGPPIMETEITKRVPPIKRFVTACNCLPRPWRALLALAFTRHKHDRRTIESCTNIETRKLFLTCTSKVIVIWYREWNEIGS